MRDKNPSAKDFREDRLPRGRASHDFARNFIGVDIAKDWIDVSISTSKHDRIPTPKQSLARFAKTVCDAFVILEASGRYKRPVTEASLGRALCLCDPAPSPRICPRHGPTDQDRQSRCQNPCPDGAGDQPCAHHASDPDTARLADLVARRGVLVWQIRAEKNRAKTKRDR
jgi:hypothetical protein